MAGCGRRGHLLLIQFVESRGTTSDKFLNSTRALQLRG
jgi:hypothetical protein